MEENRTDARSSIGDLTAAQLRQTLSHLLPQLHEHWARPLQSYAQTVYRIAAHRRGCLARDEAMLLLQKCVERTALRSGANLREAAHAAQQLAAAPVIQTGPHCHLLIEPDAFYTHLFSLLGLNADGLKWHIWYSASTVKFIERPKKGPGWLLLEGEPVNVFGLPRRRMDSYSVCGFNGPYSFRMAGSRETPANRSAGRLKAILPETQFASAVDAIKAGNQALWAWAFPAQRRLLQLDDIDIADLVADHFEDPHSWLSSRFAGNDLVARTILEAMDQLNASPWAGWVRRTTDFFWGLASSGLFPLRLVDGVLSGAPGKAMELRFEPAAIAAALRKREIVPSLFMTFLVSSILPGVRVLGGCRQIVYYPLMRYVLSVALRISGDEDLLTSLSADDCPGVWGHRVLKPSDGSPFLELERSRLTDLFDCYGQQPLEQACGDLASFISDPMWAGLTAAFADRIVTVRSPEWKWV